MEAYRAHIEAGIQVYGRMLDLDDAHIEDAMRVGMRAAVESYAQQQAGGVPTVGFIGDNHSGGIVINGQDVGLNGIDTPKAVEIVNRIKAAIANPGGR